MSLRTFPPEMSSTPGIDEKTPLMRSISTSSDVLNRSMVSHLQHPTEALQRPRPTQIQTQSSFFPLACVLTTVVLERVTYYGILANLLIFLMNDVEFSSSVSVGVVFVFISMAWMMSQWAAATKNIWAKKNHHWLNLNQPQSITLSFRQFQLSISHTNPDPPGLQLLHWLLCALLRCEEMQMRLHQLISYCTSLSK